MLLQPVYTDAESRRLAYIALGNHSMLSELQTADHSHKHSHLLELQALPGNWRETGYHCEAFLISIDDDCHTRDALSLITELCEHFDNPVIIVGSRNRDMGRRAIDFIEAGAQEFFHAPEIHSRELESRLSMAIARLRRHEQRQSSRSDALTGLNNRDVFNQRLRDNLAQCQQQQRFLAVFILGLDHFKTINDSLGHDRGDQLLQNVAHRLASAAPGSALIARLGGDEFGFICDVGDNKEASVAISESLLESLEPPFHIGNQELFIGAGIGVAIDHSLKNSASTLLKQADIALNKAKAGGRNQIQHFTPEFETGIRIKMLIQHSLHRALENGEFFLEYQPKISLEHGTIFGFEALLRWRHPKLGIIAPDIFIPLLEQSALVNEVGAWVMDTACAQLVEWQLEGLIDDQCGIAINVAATQFDSNALLETVWKAMSDHGIRANQLELELTERMLMDNAGEIIRKLNSLKDMGVHISIDDFGTGYSSLNYLKSFPIDSLKIDRSFVCDIAENGEDRSIAAAIISLSKVLGFEVIAEGVETEAQLHILDELGCRQFQGFFFSKAKSAERIGNILREQIKAF